MSDDTPLQCGVKDNCLVVRIGIGRLAWSAKKRNGGPVPNQIKMADKTEWAKDVAAELRRENELGDTMLTCLLDEAMEKAMDNGSAGLEYK